MSESGLDLTKVDRTSFVANIIEINAGIYASNNNVSFLAGDNVYDHNRDAVDTIDVGDEAELPHFAHR